MRRSLYIATWYIATCVATLSFLLALPAWAQRRGGGGGAHFASGGGHPSASFRGPSASFRSGSFGHTSGIRLRSGNSSFRRRVFYGSRFYPYGAYYPYYGWYSDPLDYQGDDQTANSYVDSYGPPPNQADSGLQRDLDSLNGKIDRLQADVEARNHPKAGMEPATALVFRDQHVEEVHNYAIAGGTLWVLNDQAAKKIPLDQLDLPATTKMNDDRGVDFQVPGPSLQLMIMR
ncbi:MAG: hypothetical protein WBE45_02010 [Terriglobales bacterium]